jgi:hypothetical protein
LRRNKQKKQKRRGRKEKKQKGKAIETKLSKKVENQKAEEQALSEKKPFPKY